MGDGFGCPVTQMEITALLPGNCIITSTVDPKTGYIKHKASFDPDILTIPKEELIDFAFSTEDSVLREHSLGLIYGHALKDQMEAAMSFVFREYLNSDVPAKADNAINKYWVH